MNLKFFFFFHFAVYYFPDTHQAEELCFGGMSIQTASFSVVQATSTCLPIAVQLVQRWHSSQPIVDLKVFPSVHFKQPLHLSAPYTGSTSTYFKKNELLKSILYMYYMYMSTFITLCGRAIMSDIQVKRYGHSGVTDSDVTYVIITSREILELILYLYHLYKEN